MQLSHKRLPEQFHDLGNTWIGLYRRKGSEPPSVTLALCTRLEPFTTPWSNDWRRSFST